MKHKIISTCSALMVMAATVGALHAQDAQPTLDDLLNVTPDGAAPDEATPEPGVADPGVADPGRADPERIDPNVERLLDGDEAANRFEQAVAEMADVATRLQGGDQPDPGLDTQRMQEAILKKLDAVIEAAKQQQQQQQQSSSSSSSSGQQGEPKQGDQGSQANQSQGQPEPGGEQDGGQDPSGQQAGSQQKGDQASQNADAATRRQAGEGTPEDPRAIGEARQEWGNLPPRLRGELSDGFGEPYSPVYRSLTESYYRKLAEMAEE